MSIANSRARLVVGLGNPGKQYKKTRHNAGFMVIDELMTKLRITHYELRKKFDSEIIDIKNNQRIILAKPQTFMNNSGAAVAKIARFYRLPLDRIFIVYDDIDLPLGILRVRQNGGSGGHNGAQSIIDALGSNAFPRFRLGVGPVPPGIDPADFVLSPFAKDEQKTAEELISRAADAIVRVVEERMVKIIEKLN